MSLDSDVYAASCLIMRKPIKNLMKYYRNFYHIYPFTTENLSGYFKKLDLKDKTILTTGSSADQILNAISMGCMDITCFDINPFVKYYYDLKVVAIKYLNHEGFIDFFSISHLDSTKTKINLYNGFQKETYCYLSKYLSGDSKKFWDTLFYNYTIEEIKSGLFFPMKLSLNKIKKVNNYLDKNVYYELRNNINDANVKFIKTDIRTLNYNIKDKFDYIILSNLLQYIHSFKSIDSLKKIKKLLLNLENNLKETGQIEVCYLYDYEEKYNDERGIRYNKLRNVFSNSQIYYLSFPSVSKKTTFNLKKDSVLMYKKEDTKVYKKNCL